VERTAALHRERQPIAVSAPHWRPDDAVVGGPDRVCDTLLRGTCRSGLLAATAAIAGTHAVESRQARAAAGPGRIGSEAAGCHASAWTQQRCAHHGWRYRERGRSARSYGNA